MTDGSLDDLPPASLVALIHEVRTALAAAQARIAALEAAVARLSAGGPPRKTAANSSVPPAKGWKARRAEPPAGTERPKRGPRFAPAGGSRPRAGGGAALPRLGGTVVARRQVTALPPVRPVVIEAQRRRGRCRRGGHGTVGCSPEGFGTTGACGPRLVATATLLHEEHHSASARRVAVVAGLFDLPVREGALVEAVGRLEQRLRPLAETIAEEVRTSPVIGSDETSARVDGVNWWHGVFQTPTAAYHTIQRRRNTEVVLTFLDGTIPRVWTSDLWKPHRKAPAVQ
jgi:transposase